MTRTPSKRAAAAPAPRPKDLSQAERLNHWGGDPSFMLSLARGLLVLQTVAKARGKPVSTSELAAATGLTRAAARRCLYTLEAIGYVFWTDDGGLPGPQLASLASAYLSSSPLLSGFEPILKRLQETIQQSVAFGIFESGEPLHVASFTSGNPINIRVPIYARIPLYCTSVGRIFLYNMTIDKLSEYLDNTEMVARTDRTITSRPELMSALDKARSRGYALVDQEVERGLRSVSVPIKDRRDCVIGWISVNTLTTSIGVRELRSRVIPEMTKAALELSALVP
jgi:IclR family pca regulon transcriptional regulator